MTLNFFVQVGFILVSTSFGLIAGDGHLAQAPGTTWEFLFRPWIPPPVTDWWAFVATGLAVGIGGLMMSQAYRTTQAALVALAPAAHAALRPVHLGFELALHVVQLARFLLDDRFHPGFEIAVAVGAYAHHAAKNREGA